MTPTPNHHALQEVLHLEIALEQGRLKISLASQRDGEMQTVRHVEEVAMPEERIGRRCRRIVETLNRANRSGSLAPDLMQKLKENGQHFRDELFPISIKNRLNDTTADQLILTLDDQLVHIPWELLHDGKTFLCQRFAMGRVVRTRQTVSASHSRMLTPPLQMLILADPGGDLNAAYQEGVNLRDDMDTLQSSMQVAFRSQGVSADMLKAKLRNYDLIHFAGHATYDDHHPENSGWRLSKGSLSAADIAKMAGTGSMPALVFSNACQSARTDARDISSNMHHRIFGLANAFILSGVKHYVGTFWEISDETSQRFSSAFYHFFLKGMPIGKAVQAARLALIETLGEQNIIWASYLLYGDPTAVYVQDVKPDTQAETQGCAVDDTPPVAAVSETRTPEDIIHFASRKTVKSRRGFLYGAAVVALMVAVAGIVLSRSPGVSHHEQLALAAFKEGNYGRVEQTCRQLQDKAPRRGLSYLLLGNVNFFKGELEQARYLYQHAVQAELSSEMDKAEALIGLGRIASENGLPDQALHYYQKAGELSPSSERPYLAQALLLEQQGDFEQAAGLLRKAQATARTDNLPLEGLTARLEAKANHEADMQRKARVDQLVDKLTQQLAAVPEPLPEPQWSSRPLTLWVMDLEQTGYTLQEGSAVLLTSAVTDRLLQNKSIRIVERVLLDKMMEELRLGSSKLADPGALLQLGHLISARIIVYGRMVHSAPHARVTLRCIDTETGQIIAMVNADFDAQASVADMATRIADELALKVKKHYPLKAKVIKTKQNTLVLDVGHRQGAAIGIELQSDTGLTAKITTVAPDQCTARIQGSAETAAVGTRLQAVP
ncbi:MAG: CHAT domain-containing protein [Desulfobacteraceae bacterium]|jgi:CHAT domain-containing protein/tetratricopeptide (TPR) repeat protein